jgi:hypothetical protein
MFIIEAPVDSQEKLKSPQIKKSLASTEAAMIIVPIEKINRVSS